MSNSKKFKISDASDSLFEVNVPEVSEIGSQFVYNFYTRDERVNYPVTTANFGNTLPLSKIARYVVLGWKNPPVSLSPIGSSREFSVSYNDQLGKILSEEEFFNTNMLTHFFSDVSAIEQGANDIENYSRMSYQDAESVFKMSQYQLKEIASKSESASESADTQLSALIEDYSKLIDFPKCLLGLRVYNSQGEQVEDDSNFIKSLTDSLTLNVKVNVAVIPDVFKNSMIKDSKFNFKKLQQMFEEYMGNKAIAPEKLPIPVVYNTEDVNFGPGSIGNPYSVVGHIVEKYVAYPDGFKRENVTYIDDPTQTSIIDKEILYGLTYVYSVRTVVAMTVLTYVNDQSGFNKTVGSVIYVSSRPKNTIIECNEYVQPPEPIGLNFSYDYFKRRFIVSWDMPVNPQRDVKQFQVMRRKSIKHPFELIAQYGFDDSIPGKSGLLYRTGERVDPNNYENMLDEDKFLVRFVRDDPSSPPRSTYNHVDLDFVVDSENAMSSEYIYAVCSVDAHGLISNYSAQHHVVFDVYKNRLSSRIVCDAGSPRQYPNMKLRMDAFKDVIKVEGDAARQLSVHFTPEYDRIKDKGGNVNTIVMTKKMDQNAHYLLQLINLDNQKMQTLKIEIDDTSS